jgi:large subunit ribosomal protein L24
VENMGLKVSSVKPSRQRKSLFQAPIHVRHKMLSATLSPELRSKYFIRSLPVRKGDTVRILRGAFKGVEGKIRKVDLKKFRVTIDGVAVEKADGTTVYVPIHPSNLMITKLDLSDKWRAKRLEKVVEEKLAEVEEEESETEKIEEAE